MFTYTIKKDGYPLGQAVGKKKAVDHLKRELAFWSIDHLAEWQNKPDDTINAVIRYPDGKPDEIYTIERGTA